MNKFGLLDDSEPETLDLSMPERLATFRNVQPRQPVDIAAMDAAAASHGFVSRESEPTPVPNAPVYAAPAGRRRRAIPSEPTRHLAIRLTTSGYNRFVAYADREQLTYHDALIELMNKAGE